MNTFVSSWTEQKDLGEERVGVDVDQGADRVLDVDGLLNGMVKTCTAVHLSCDEKAFAFIASPWHPDWICGNRSCMSDCAPVPIEQLTSYTVSYSYTSK